MKGCHPQWLLTLVKHNPLTGVHTNTIEGVWSLVRGDLRKYRGLRRNALQLFLDEYAFKRNMRRTDEGVWTKMMLAIGTKQTTTAPPVQH